MSFVVRTENGTYCGPYGEAVTWSEVQAKKEAERLNASAEKQGVKVRYEVKEED